MLNGELRKMNLRGNWHKTYIDSVHLSFAEFLTGTRQKNLYLQKLYTIFIIRCREIANVEYAEICNVIVLLERTFAKNVVYFCKTEIWEGDQSDIIYL